MKISEKFKVLLLFGMMAVLCVIPFVGDQIYTSYLEQKITRITGVNKIGAEEFPDSIEDQLEILASIQRGENSAILQLEMTQKGQVTDQDYTAVLKQLKTMAELGAIPQLDYEKSTSFEEQSRFLLFRQGNDSGLMSVSVLMIQYQTFSLSLLYNTQTPLIYNLYLSGQEEEIKGFSAQRGFYAYLNYLGLKEIPDFTARNQEKGNGSYEDKVSHCLFRFSSTDNELNYWIE